MKTLALPERTQDLINNYLNIHSRGISTACPYHINHSLFSRKLSMLGKGTPADIEDEVERAFTSLGFNPHSPEQLQSYMRACGIGIDCSGFVGHILDSVSQETTGRPLTKHFKAGGARNKLTVYLRKHGALSASTLTSPKNCNPVNNLAQARPGDLIRIPGGRHVILINEISLDQDNNACEISYVQSSCKFLEESGVVTGMVRVVKDRELHELNWQDNTKLKNVTNEVLKEHKDSSLVRPKFLNA